MPLSFVSSIIWSWVCMSSPIISSGMICLMTLPFESYSVWKTFPRASVMMVLISLWFWS